jgi:RHS repeat-associated protein
MKILSLRAAVAALSLLAVSSALAQTALPHDEWETDAIAGRTFPSADAAIAATRSLGGKFAYAEIQRDVSDADRNGRTRYALDAAKRPNPVLGQWQYAIPWGVGVHNTEEAAIESARTSDTTAAFLRPSPGCVARQLIITPLEPWDVYTKLWESYWLDRETPIFETRRFRFEFVGGGPGCDQDTVVQARRERTAVCEGTPHLSWNPNYAACALDGIATVSRLTSSRQCPQSREPELKVSPDVKDNPCELRSGTKLHFETDVALPWISFGRAYSSTDAYSDQFGSGWVHSLNYRLRVRLGQPTTLVMPDRSVSAISSLALRDASNRSLVVNGTGWDLVDGGRTLHFNTVGRLHAITLPGGLLNFSYSTDGRIEAIRHFSGRSLVFRYLTVIRRDSAWGTNALAPLDRLAAIDLDGVPLVEYGYDTLARLVRVRWADGRVRTYGYTEPDVGSHLKSIDDNGVRYATYRYSTVPLYPINQNGEFRYGEIGRLIRSEHGNGRLVGAYTYLPDGSTQTTDANGSVETYRFTDRASGRKVTAIEGGPGTRRYTYASTFDGQPRLTESVDAKDNITRYAYSTVTDAPTGLSVIRRQATEAFGTPHARSVSRFIDSRRGQTILLQEPGRETRTTYNANGWPTRVAVRDTATNAVHATDATYDPEGRILTIDGPRTDAADVTTYTYFDAEDPACASSPTTCTFRKGDLKSVTNALGQTTHFVRYDGAGRLLESRDANGLVSTFTYTPRGWLASRTSGGLTTSIDYTAVGDVERVTTPDGRSLTYTYDTARRLTAVSDQRGNRIDWTLDNAGNRTAEAVKDASGTLRRTLTQQFNTLGRLSQAANAAGQATLFTQDPNGNLDLASDPLNRTTDQDVDALDRVTKQLQDVAGLNVQTQFSYDALDQLTTVTDPKGLITRYTHDGLGNLLKLESPDTGTTTYAVDAAGNRTRQTDARGVVVNYSYDALNRLTGISFPTASLNTSFVYDSAAGCPAGETFAIGRLSSMTDASGSTRWCYDQLGRLTRKVQVTNGRTFTTAYAYDAQGRLSTQTLPSGAIVRFGYASGEVATVAVRLPGSSVDLPLINAIERLPFGPVSKLTYGNGRTQTRTFDLDYAIDRIASSEASGWTQDYGVDAVGNITAILGTGSNNRFRYDGLDRLTHADNTSNVTQRQYPVDATGNRTGKQTSATGVITPYVYAATNHRLAQTGTEARTYDAVGNPITIGTRTLTYDERSRLTVFVNGSTTRRYQYTGQGLRVRKWTSSNTSGNTYFVYNENAQLIGEYDNAGSRVQEILWLGNLPVGVIAGTAAAPVLHYIESDHLGTPRVIVDATRNVGIWRWNQSNDPFGESSPNQNPDGDATSVTFNLRFAGQYRDSESGWYYNVHRYYDPATGRYLESDPIGLGGGISTYSYVGAAPLTAVDPLGLFQFGTRPLEDLDPIQVRIPGTTTQLFHENGFYSDGSNVGFFPEGIRADEPHWLDDYTMKGPHYDDALMRQAEQNLRNSGRFKPDDPNTPFWRSRPEEYQVLQNNCQDFAEAMRAEYRRLGGRTCSQPFQSNGHCADLALIPYFPTSAWRIR